MNGPSTRLAHRNAIHTWRGAIERITDKGLPAEFNRSSTCFSLARVSVFPGTVPSSSTDRHSPRRIPIRKLFCTTSGDAMSERRQGSTNLLVVLRSRSEHGVENSGPASVNGAGQGPRSRKDRRIVSFPPRTGELRVSLGGCYSYRHPGH